MENYISVPVPPPWGTKFNRPWSLVQSLMLSHIDSGSNKFFYDLKAVTVRQLHKSRAQQEDDANSTDARSAVTVSTVTTNERGLRITRRLDRKSPHVIVHTSSTGDVFLDVNDGMINWRVNDRGILQADELNVDQQDSVDEHDIFFSIAYAKIEPSSDSCIRFIDAVHYKRLGKLGCDFEMFHGLVSHPEKPELQDRYEWARFRQLRSTLLLLREDGTKLSYYNMGNVQPYDDAYLTFVNETKDKKIYQYNSQDDTFAVSQRPSLPSTVLTEFVIFKYPHLRLESRVRILKPDGNTNAWVDFYNTYIVITWKTGKIEFHEVQDLLKSARVIGTEGDLDGRGHCTNYLVESIPKPLFCLNAKSVDSNSRVNSPYIIARTNQNYEIRELIRGKDVSVAQYVSFDDGSNARFFCFLDEVQVEFMEYESALPRIIVKERMRIRIYEIFRRDDEHHTIGVQDGDRNNSYRKISGKQKLKLWRSFLRLVFDKNYHSEVQKDYTESDRTLPNGMVLRKNPCKVYGGSDFATVCCGENISVGQLAVIRFAVGWVRCYVYDLNNYELQYTVEPSFFQPTRKEVNDSLEVIFSNDLVVLIRQGTHDISAYCFNLCHGLE